MDPEQNTVKNALARCEPTEQVIPALLGCVRGEQTSQVPEPHLGQERAPSRGSGWETIGTDPFRACRMPENKGFSLCSSGGAAQPCWDHGPPCSGGTAELPPSQF